MKKKQNPDTAADNTMDLPSPPDENQLHNEDVILDLPEVKDIPGQENIVPPKMNAFSNTTISSDDEEGYSVRQRRRE